MYNIPYPCPSTAQNRLLHLQGALWRSLGRTVSRIVICAAEKIPEDALDFPLIEYSEKEYGDFFGLKSPKGTFRRYHEEIKNTEILLEDTDTGESRLYRLCEECHVSNGVIRIRFSPEMTPFLLQSRLNWFIEQKAFHEHAPRLTPIETQDGIADEAIMEGIRSAMNPFHVSEYMNPEHARFYALIRKYRGNVEFPIERLRELLLLGEKYKKPSHFIGTYLPAVKKDIEKYYDISFTFQPIKQGRGFESVKFDIQVTHPLRGNAIEMYFLLYSPKAPMHNFTVNNE